MVENNVPESQKNVANSMSSFMKRIAPKGLIKRGLESTMGDEFLFHIGLSLIKIIYSLIDPELRLQLLALINDFVAWVADYSPSVHISMANR